jgi:hypothetical protein
MSHLYVKFAFPPSTTTFSIYNKTPPHFQRLSINIIYLLVIMESKYTRLECCNLNLGLETDAKGYKVASQEGDRRVTSYALGSAKCVREFTLIDPSELLV